MSDSFTNPAMQAGAVMLVLCVLIAAAFYLLSSFRDYAADDQEEAFDAVAKLQEMHRKGDISDEEFRTIQATTHRHPVRSNRDGPSPTSEPSPKT
jgi:uncharacterized membrane protein